MGPKVVRGPGTVLPHSVAIGETPVASLYTRTPSNTQLECAKTSKSREYKIRTYRRLAILSLCQFSGTSIYSSLAFHLEDLKGEEHHSLLSCIDGVVAVGPLRIVGWIIWRNHTATGGCEICATS